MSCQNCIHNNVCYLLKLLGDAGVGDHFFNPLEKIAFVCQHYLEAGQLPEPTPDEGQTQVVPEEEVKDELS
jgi:hypothetical protein